MSVLGISKLVTLAQRQFFQVFQKSTPSFWFHLTGFNMHKLSTFNH